MNPGGRGDICDGTQISRVSCCDGGRVDGPVETIICAHLLVHIADSVLRSPTVRTDLGVSAVKAVGGETCAVVVIARGIDSVTHGVACTHPRHKHKGLQGRTEMESSAATPTNINVKN